MEPHSYNQTARPSDTPPEVFPSTQGQGEQASPTHRTAATESGSLAMGASVETSNEVDPQPFDIDQLASLAAELRQPDTLLVRDVPMSERLRSQLSNLAGETHRLLQPIYQTPKWQKLMRLMHEGGSTGKLQAFSSHKGTNVPMWCVDGGDDPLVKKVKRETEIVGEDGMARTVSSNGVQVPRGIFAAFDLHLAAERLSDFARLSDKTLKGASGSNLAQPLETALNLMIALRDQAQAPQSS